MMDYLTEAISREALSILKDAMWLNKFLPKLKPIPWYHKMWLKMTFQRLPTLAPEMPKATSNTIKIRRPILYTYAKNESN